MAISSSDQYIDPRDVVSEADTYRDDIESKQEDITEANDDLDAEDAVDEQVEISERIEQLEQELVELEADAETIFELERSCEDYAHGETLINEEYFTEYAKNMAEDCGSENLDNWPYNCIDWDQAAQNLQMDYTTIEWEGESFLVRS